MNVVCTAAGSIFVLFNVFPMSERLFFLDAPLREFSRKIRVQDELIFVGSCFSEQLSHFFSRVRLRSIVNPFGTLYDPLSISHNLTLSAKGEWDTHAFMDKMVKHDDVWYHFDFHGMISDTQQDRLLKKVKDVYQQTYKQLCRSDWIVLTLGSSVVYRYHNLFFVSNCHKLSSRCFTESVLTPQEIAHALDSMMNELWRINPRLKFIYTISPVRYLKLGLMENSLSKSRLQLAIASLCSPPLSNQQVFYFPSFELMMDILRDYRFYKEDKLHPSDEAVAFIWKRFKQVVLDNTLLEYLSHSEPIRMAFEHRIRYPHISSSLAFFSTYYEKVIRLKRMYPYLNFDEWIHYFSTNGSVKRV